MQAAKQVKRSTYCKAGGQVLAQPAVHVHCRRRVAATASIYFSRFYVRNSFGGVSHDPRLVHVGCVASVLDDRATPALVLFALQACAMQYVFVLVTTFCCALDSSQQPLGRFLQLTVGLGGRNEKTRHVPAHTLTRAGVCM